MSAAAELRHVTPQPWHARLQHARYATDATYELAAAWVGGCKTVADWGGGPGYLRRYLSPETDYVCVDGTEQAGGPHVLADLTTYRVQSEGIVLRHVLDMTEDWEAILRNALAAFTQRMVVVTFTPDVPETRLTKLKSGWPLRAFNPGDLRRLMAPWLMLEDVVETTHPERIYFLERTR